MSSEAGDTTARSGLTIRLHWLRPFLWGLAGTLGLCGTMLGFLSLLPVQDGEIPPMVKDGLLYLIGGVIFALVGLKILFGKKPGSGYGVIGLLAATAIFCWARSQEAMRGGHRTLTVDPAELSASLALSCLIGACLLFMLFPLARVVTVSSKGHPRWRLATALLCGVLTAGIGVAVGREFTVEEQSPVKVVTAEAPQQLPELGPVFDARQATGEVAWTFDLPSSTRDIEIQVGVRGPIVTDGKVVLGLDGETGRLLWSHDFKVREIQTQWYKLGEPVRDLTGVAGHRRLVVSPDGATVAYISFMDEKENPWDKTTAVLSVVDAATGQVRFTLSPENPWVNVVMTDHVVVVGGVAHDLVTGGELWRYQGQGGLVAGPNGSSHLLLTLSDEEKTELGLPKKRCATCSDRAVKVVSDRDPTQVIEVLDGLAELKEHASVPVLVRGWVLEKKDDEGNHDWVNIDTLERVPVETIEDYSEAILPLRGDTPVLVGRSTEEEKALGTPYRVFDPWTGESRTFRPRLPGDVGNVDPLGVGVWVSWDEHKIPVLDLWGPDGDPVGERIVPPTPKGAKSYRVESVRTRHGIVSGVIWHIDWRSEGAVIVMYR